MHALLVGACPYPTRQGSQIYLGGMARALVRAGLDVTIGCYGLADDGGKAGGPHTEAQRHRGGSDEGKDEGDAAPGGEQPRPTWNRGGTPRPVAPTDLQPRVVRGARLPGYTRTRSGPDLVKPWLDLDLARVVAGTPGDVVVAHGHEGMLVALLARRLEGLRRLARRPIVYAPHTAFGEELPTYLPAGYARLRGPLGLAGGALDDTLPRRADACLSISRRMDELLREAGARRVVPGRPGIDPDEFRDLRPERPSPPDARWVAYCGNPDAYQDLPVLARAMSIVRAERGPDAPRLVVIGDWPEADVRAVAPDAVVRPRDWAHARDVLAGCDAAVIPRTRCAGFPMKLLNQVALGLPTVIAEGSAQGLPGEIVVTNHDARALAEGFERACVAPRVPLQAREEVGWDRTIAPVAALLRELAPG